MISRFHKGKKQRHRFLDAALIKVALIGERPSISALRRAY